MPKPKLPKFDNLDELADFLDTHDTEDYEWKEAEHVTFAKPLKVQYVIQVDESVGSALVAAARKRRTKVDKLASKILREGLARAG